MEELIKEWLETDSQIKTLQLKKDLIMEELEKNFSSQLKEEGSTTVKFNEYKLTFKKGYNYSFDQKKYESILPEIAFPVHKIKYELDEKKYKEEMKDANALDKVNFSRIHSFNLTKSCVMIKPAKTNLQIKQQED